MSAGERTVPGKARTSKKRGAKASGAFHKQIVEHLCGALLPGEIADGPGGASAWIEEVAPFVLAAAQQRVPGEPVIELASVSGERRVLRIAIVNDDMPFLVDSVAAAVADAGLVIDRLVHPVLSVQRDAKGGLTGLPDDAVEGTVRESMIYVETARADARTSASVVSSERSSTRRSRRLAAHGRGDARRCGAD